MPVAPSVAVAHSMKLAHPLKLALHRWKQTLRRTHNKGCPPLHYSNQPKQLHFLASIAMALMMPFPRSHCEAPTPRQVPPLEQPWAQQASHPRC